MKTLAILLAFLVGLLFCLRYKHRDLVEGLKNEGGDEGEEGGEGDEDGGEGDEDGGESKKKEKCEEDEEDEEDTLESLNQDFSCPNLLVKRGKEVYLLNKRKAVIPGVNPIRFDNLEQYAEYLRWQRRVGIRCPVLFFEEGYNTQNQKIWRFANDPFNPEGGNPTNDVMRGAGDHQIGKLLDANRDTNPPHNQGGYAAYDPKNQNIGKYTPLDKMFHSKGDFSDNPMDANWRGRGH